MRIIFGIHLISLAGTTLLITLGCSGNDGGNSEVSSTDSNTDTYTKPIFDTETETSSEIDTSPQTTESCIEDYGGKCNHACGSQYDELILDEPFGDCEKHCCIPRPQMKCEEELGGYCDGTGLGCPTEMPTYEGPHDCDFAATCCAPPVFSCTEDLEGTCKKNGDNSCTMSKFKAHTDCELGYYCCYDDGCTAEIEPNGEKASAQSLPVSTTICGRLTKVDGVADLDFYKFTLNAPSDVTVKIHETPDNFLSPKLYLYEETSDLTECTIENACLGSTERDPFGTVEGVFAHLVQPLEAGTYYVGFDQNGSAVDGAYRVSVFESKCTSDATECDGTNLRTCSALNEWATLECSGTCENIDGLSYHGCIQDVAYPYEGAGTTTHVSSVFVPEYYSFQLNEDGNTAFVVSGDKQKHVFIYESSFTPKSSEDTAVGQDGCLFHATGTTIETALNDLASGIDYYVRVEGLVTQSPQVGDYTIKIEPAVCSSGDRQCLGNTLAICNDLQYYDMTECAGNCEDRGDGVHECRGSANTCWDALNLDPSLTDPQDFTVAESTISGGFENLVTCQDTQTGREDYWFKFTANSTTQKIDVHTGSMYANIMNVNLYSGACGPTSLIEMTESDGTTSICKNHLNWGATKTLNATGLAIGQTYFISVAMPDSGATISLLGEDISITFSDIP